MRLPESETSKLSVKVATLVAPVISKTAPLQCPPTYELALSVPDPVVGSNEVLVRTVIGVFTSAGDVVPETGAAVEVLTAQLFPAASLVICSISVTLNATAVGTGETELQEIGTPALKQIVTNPLNLPANLPARLASVTPPSSSWAWVTLTGTPTIVAIKSTNPNPVAIRTFIMVLAPPRLERWNDFRQSKSDETEEAFRRCGRRASVRSLSLAPSEVVRQAGGSAHFPISRVLQAASGLYAP